MNVLKVMHQGDVMFMKVAELPNYSKKTQLTADTQRGLVIQHGEALGHFHRVDNDHAHAIQAYSIGEVADSIQEMAFVVKEPVPVVHEEHNTLTLDTGFWIARTQRETIRGMRRAVVD